MKKKKILMMLAITFILAGCGNGANEEVGIAAETKEMETGELATQEASNLNLAEMSADELLDLFVEGKLAANYNSVDKESFYITDLPIDVVDDWYSFSIGHRLDLDNDSEKELVLNGPYGGMFLDARDGQIFVLAEGDGTIATLSYTQFDGQTWIVHSDTTHGGRETYDFTLYDGTGKVVDTFRLMKEYWDTPNEPEALNTVYTYRDKEITREEYGALFEKFLHSLE